MVQLSISFQELRTAIHYTEKNSNGSSTAARSNGTLHREGHLMVLLPLTKANNENPEGDRILEEFRLYNQLSAFLAYKHFMKRSGEVLSELPDRLAGCDFQWTVAHHDDQYSPLQAARELLTYYDRDTNASTHGEPFAIVGSARSAVSAAVSALGAALEVPQISSSSTAKALDQYPLFARTITGNADARSMMSYLKSLGVTHAGLLFVKDSWGGEYAQNAAFYGKQLGTQLSITAYNLEEDLDRIMESLLQTKLVYFVGAISSSAWKPVIAKLYEHNLIGPSSNRQWFFAEMTELLREGFVLSERDLALALHGTGIVTQKVVPHEALDRALAAFSQDAPLQEEFIQCFGEKEQALLRNITFDPTPGRSLIQYLTYDAVIALGITACETPGMFTGQEFYHNLLLVDFEGTSGRVQLDHRTGTRTDDAFDYEIVNLVLTDFANTSGLFSFSKYTSAVVDFPENTVLGDIATLHPFTYFDNTTQIPPALPPVAQEMNLIPIAVIWTGYTLGILVMLFSVIFALWVYLYRKKQVVQAAQPIFLYQLCFGTFLTAVTIIPLSFQEDMPGLDQACLATPWFLCIGFCVALSALFSKSARISRLLASGASFRRIKVQPIDVMRPFAIMTSINVVLLTAWTASPFRLSWQRIQLENYDEFGRSVESVGLCRPGGNNEYLGFLIPLVVANIVVLVLATYQTYQARNLPTDFSEANCLFVSMVSLSETCLLGGTTVIAVFSNPASFYIVMSMIICLGCMAILLPMFIPKYLKQNERVARPSQSRPDSSMSHIVSQTSSIGRLSQAASRNDRRLLKSKGVGKRLEVHHQLDLTPSELASVIEANDDTRRLSHSTQQSRGLTAAALDSGHHHDGAIVYPSSAKLESDCDSFGSRSSAKPGRFDDTRRGK